MANSKTIQHIAALTGPLVAVPVMVATAMVATAMVATTGTGAAESYDLEYDALVELPRMRKSSNVMCPICKRFTVLYLDNSHCGRIECIAPPARL